MSYTRTAVLLLSIICPALAFGGPRARNYQTDVDDWDWPSRTKIERVATTRPETVTLSPNGAYYFALDELSRKSIIVFVFDVEKERVLLTESTHDGALAMEQSRDTCPRLGGCQCLPKAGQ